MQLSHDICSTAGYEALTVVVSVYAVVCLPDNHAFTARA